MMRDVFIVEGVKRYVAAGYLGKKVKKGFFEY